MSTSPIGTRVPTLAPNAIIRAGIPLSDNFNATDVAVSLGSLLDSGSYVPIASSETNLTTFSYPSTFIRVGNIVNAFVIINITMDVAEDTGSFELSLPFETNFTGSKQLNGVIQWSKDSISLSEITAINIVSNSGGSTMLVDITTATTNANLTSCVIAFQYEVI
jgi:hypothetical protein